MLTATAKLRNVADRPVTVVAAFYVVDGRRSALAFARSRDAARASANATGGDAVSEPPSLLPPGSVLEPGEEVVEHLTFPPRRDGDVASMRVDLAVARPRYRQGEHWSAHRVAPDVVHLVARVEDRTWLHDITRLDRYLHLVHARHGDLGCDDGRQFTAYIDGERTTDPERWCGRRTRFDEHYGVVTEQFSAEVPMRPSR